MLDMSVIFLMWMKDVPPPLSVVFVADLASFS